MESPSSDRGPSLWEMLLVKLEQSPQNKCNVLVMMIGFPKLWSSRTASITVYGVSLGKVSFTVGFVVGMGKIIHMGY